MAKSKLVTTRSPVVQDCVMVDLKTPAMVTKIFNKLAMHSTLWDVHTLEVSRRNAIDPQRVPVIPLEYEGSLFVVSTRGESDWVKNVRAWPGSSDWARRATSRRMPPRRCPRTGPTPS
jgi:hypothetical protein